jgi:sugar/nucleoside kinase (ribokinase family)
VNSFDYVTVGHVTADVIEPGGERRPGGGAFYSALQAARLGLKALILTRGQPQELQELLAPYRDELELRIQPAEHSTTLATSGMGEQRRQRMLAWAGAMAAPCKVDAQILHLAAVARETPTRVDGSAGFVGATPQGLMRRWSEGGEVTLAPLRREALPERLNALVVSEREQPFCAQAIEELRSAARHLHGTATGGGADVIAVTAGGAPTTVLTADGRSVQVPTPQVQHARDDLGAGDVFAAAFFIALQEGREPVDAARRGNAAAALRIAGQGAQAVADAAAIARAQHR